MSLFAQVYRSFRLDWEFISRSNEPFAYKSGFLKEKYRIKIKHFFRPFSLGISSARIGSREIFYESQYGLSGFQSLLSRDQYLIGLSNIKHANVIIDVGANVGFFGEAIINLFPRAQVYCLEPILPIFECLEKNMQSQPSIHTFNLAISDTDGELVMEFDPNDTVLAKIAPSGGLGIHVRAITLDQFVDQNNITRIDILKVDTETYEAHVLRGAKKALAMTRYIFIELTVENNKNYTISSLMRMLNGDGFNFQILSFRNYDGKSMGKVRVFDCFMENLDYKL